MMATATGLTIAPPTACRTRNATSSPTLGAAPHSSDPSKKIVRPVTKTRLRPSRSAKEPASMSRAAITSV